MNKLSVIVPTYNRSKLLSYTLDSLVRQEPGTDKFEVIVSDDGSSDDTKEISMKYKDYLDLKYVYQEDKGFRAASARNNAILMSQSELCLFIDSGILLRENCVQKHIEFHFESQKRRAAIGYVYGYSGDADIQNELKKLINLTNTTATINRISDNTMFSDKRNSHYITYNDKIQDLPAPWHYFWGCHISVGYKDLIDIGMFDTMYDGRWGVEDNDLGFRLHANGVELVLLRSAEVVHYPHYKNTVEEKKEGYLNCIEFDRKFQTRMTKLFLSHFKANKLIDINAEALRD